MDRTHQDGRPRRKRDAIKHLALGHDAIDADHKVIVGCCNRLVDCGPAALEFLIRRLRVLLADHFRKEAALLKAADSTFCRCHQREHEDLLALCDRIIKVHAKDRRTAQRLIRNDLVRTLRQHIAYRDQIIALRLNSVEPCHSGCIETDASAD